MHVLSWRPVSARTRMLFWCLFPELRSQNNPLVSAETVHRESTYIIIYNLQKEIDLDIVSQFPWINNICCMLYIKYGHHGEHLGRLWWDLGY